MGLDIVESRPASGADNDPQARRWCEGLTLRLESSFKWKGKTPLLWDEHSVGLMSPHHSALLCCGVPLILPEALASPDGFALGGL